MDAEMVKLVDTRDLKSLGTQYCESSSLSLGTSTLRYEVQALFFVTNIRNGV